MLDRNEDPDNATIKAELDARADQLRLDEAARREVWLEAGALESERLQRLERQAQARLDEETAAKAAAETRAAARERERIVMLYSEGGIDRPYGERVADLTAEFRIPAAAADFALRESGRSRARAREWLTACRDERRYPFDR